MTTRLEKPLPSLQHGRPLTFWAYVQPVGTMRPSRERVHEWGVRQPIGTGMHQVEAAIASTRMLLEDILVENSTYTNRRNIKARCIEAGMLEERCYGEGCQVRSQWLGKKLTLQLEHKNGVNDDHRIENLELLCPNCHSQTETFCGRKKPRVCSECGVTKQTTSPLCRSCAAKKSHPRSTS